MPHRIVYGFTVTLAVTVLLHRPLPAPAAAAAAPNIIFIITDDQGYGDLSCHGNPILKTPNLDRLHAEGVRFTDFHVSPTCAPTRAALMTGRHEFKTGVTHTIHERERLSLKATTLAAGPQDGRLHHRHLRQVAPRRRGRRTSPTAAASTRSTSTAPAASARPTPAAAATPPATPTSTPPSSTTARSSRPTATAPTCSSPRRCSGSEQVKGKQPFYAHIATNAPHAPLDCPPEYEKLYAGKVPPNVAKFYGMIANIDDNVGRLLAKLKEWDIERDTLVIFMTDNGGTAGVPVYNAGMRGRKVTPYLGGTRAASFWRWPGTLDPARRRQARRPRRLLPHARRAGRREGARRRGERLRRPQPRPAAEGPDRRIGPPATSSPTAAAGTAARRPRRSTPAAPSAARDTTWSARRQGPQRSSGSCTTSRPTPARRPTSPRSTRRSSRSWRPRTTAGGSRSCR